VSIRHGLFSGKCFIVMNAKGVSSHLGETEPQRTHERAYARATYNVLLSVDSNVMMVQQVLPSLHNVSSRLFSSQEAPASSERHHGGRAFATNKKKCHDKIKYHLHTSPAFFEIQTQTPLFF